MTYTLGDFEIQKGDWVKADNEWREIEAVHEDDVPLVGYSIGYTKYKIVQAVLRPSIIIRETLDTLLHFIEKDSRFGTKPYRLDNTYKKVWPRKKEEPKKSLFDEFSPMRINMRNLCNEFERLEKKLDQVILNAHSGGIK